MMTEKKESHSNYKGFVAGVFSGIAKLTGMPTSHFYHGILQSEAGELWNNAPASIGRWQIGRNL
jgi:hypothetical protein